MVGEKKLFNSKEIKEGLQKTIQIGLHPTRREILKLLKKYNSLSTVEIIQYMDVAKEDRYNLYHHLDVLVDYNIIVKYRKEDNMKTFYYRIYMPENPIVLAFTYDLIEINENIEAFNDVLDKISNIEKYKIKKRKHIKSIEINVTYDYTKKGEK
tara:strand:+ start:2348 stop:2809 length:462 start_codon:yes stop_codon:yes gene_type:complete